MTIQMRKFGTVLNSRPAGREALLAISPTLPPASPEAEDIELDFAAVEVLTPSFAEEFVIGLLDRYPGHVRFKNTDNVTVLTTLDFLSRQWPEQMGTDAFGARAR